MSALLILVLYAAIGIFCFGIFEKLEKDHYEFNLDYFVPFLSLAG